MKIKLSYQKENITHLQIRHDMLNNSGDFRPSLAHPIDYNFRFEDDLKSDEKPAVWMFTKEGLKGHSEAII